MKKCTHGNKNMNILPGTIHFVNRDEFLKFVEYDKTANLSNGNITENSFVAGSVNYVTVDKHGSKAFTLPGEFDSIPSISFDAYKTVHEHLLKTQSHEPKEKTKPRYFVDLLVGSIVHSDNNKSTVSVPADTSLVFFDNQSIHCYKFGEYGAGYEYTSRGWGHITTERLIQQTVDMKLLLTTEVGDHSIYQMELQRFLRRRAHTSSEQKTKAPETQDVFKDISKLVNGIAQNKALIDKASKLSKDPVIMNIFETIKKHMK